MPPILSAKQKPSLKEKTPHSEADPPRLVPASEMENDTAYSDHELIELFQSGENPNYAFNLLVKKYQKKVYFHVRRMVIDHDDANDVVQNTFIKAWSGLSGFREDSKFFTWIYRIATNESLTFLKRKRTKFFIPLTDVEHKLSQQLSNDPLFSADALQLKLQQAILGLPEKQRIVFNMRTCRKYLEHR